ncbi:hypothetical protein TNIN_433381 [Trichonephila inaurata madagascariensis]|uniref:Uncharacterized protein n=1 Tax=Trichonephila inaurata madagascariensis TaxID=2747483 RepID=A0A8X7C1L8_9ARAC|nr:hypothetical protein TNIN_433381 [Trichonephila inaurata madagascariensis]
MLTGKSSICVPQETQQHTRRASTEKTLPTASIHFIPFSEEECIIGCPPPLQKGPQPLAAAMFPRGRGPTTSWGEGKEGVLYIGSQWWELENPCQSVSLLPSL